MRYNKYILALAFTSTLMLGSCGDDFLGKDPQGALTPEALANAQGVELLTTSAYAALSTPVEGKDPYQASPFNWVWGSLYGGDANKGSDPGDQSTLNEVELYNTMSTNDYLAQKWYWVYMVSKRVNLALQTMDLAEDLADDVRARRTAELKFLRGLAYFEGMRVFGPFIPYVDETHTENNPLVHNDVDIYDKVMADVDAAIAGLPETVADADAGQIGRANVWAAKALKAKMMMYRKDLAGAKPILKEVLESGVNAGGIALGLEDYIYNNFNALTENGKESIFSIQYSAADENNAQACLTLCYPHNSGPGGCCGFFQPSFELVNSFQVDENGLPYLNGEYRTKKSVSEKNPDVNGALGINDNTIPVDPRLDFAVGRYGIPYKDWGEPANDWVRNPVNGGIFIPKKFVLSKAENDAGMYRMYGGWAPGSAMNIQYLNVRDMTLMYAECLANDGQLAEAMEQVNKIRRRAALEVNVTKKADGTPAANYKISEYPKTHAAFSNKDVCIKAVRMERKLELAMEGERWFDLVRWSNNGDYMAQELKAYVDYEKQYITKFAGASYLPASKTMLPIPDNEILTMGTDPETGTPYLVQPEAWR